MAVEVVGPAAVAVVAVVDPVLLAVPGPGPEPPELPPTVGHEPVAHEERSTELAC